MAQPPRDNDNVIPLRRSGRKGPRTPTPRITAEGSRPTVAVAPAWTRLPRYEGITNLSTRDHFVNAAYYTASAGLEKTESVDDLLYIGAIVERSIDTGIVLERSEANNIKQFVGEVTNLNESYVRMARSWFKLSIDGNPATGTPSTLDAALDWYKREDARRDETGFKFRAQQPTGIMLVRDALKGYKEYAAARATGSADEALEAVDTKFPSVRPTTPIEKLTVSRRRDIHEALLIKLLTMMIQEGTGYGVRLRNRWPTVQAFMDWSQDHPVTDAEFRFTGAMFDQQTVTWADVDTSYDPFPEDDESNEGFFGRDPPDDDNGGGGGTDGGSTNDAEGVQSPFEMAGGTPTATVTVETPPSTTDEGTSDEAQNGEHDNGDQDDTDPLLGAAPRMMQRRTGRKSAPRKQDQKKEDNS